MMGRPATNAHRRNVLVRLRRQFHRFTWHFTWPERNRFGLRRVKGSNRHGQAGEDKGSRDA